MIFLMKKLKKDIFMCTFQEIKYDLYTQNMVLHAFQQDVYLNIGAYRKKKQKTATPVMISGAAVSMSGMYVIRNEVQISGSGLSAGLCPVLRSMRCILLRGPACLCSSQGVSGRLSLSRSS